MIGEMGIVEDQLHARVKQAQLYWLAGDPAAAAAAMARAERDARAAGWPEALATTAHGRADLARWSGEPAQARADVARAREGIRGSPSTRCSMRCCSTPSAIWTPPRAS